MRTPVITNLKSASAKKQPRRAIYNLRRKTQQSKTLVRKAVKRPKTGKATAGRIKSRIIGRNPAREARANRAIPHPKVKHFSPFTRRQDAKVKEGEVISTGAVHARTATLAVSLPSVSLGQSHHRLERLLDYALARASNYKKAGNRPKGWPGKMLHILPKWLNITLVFVILLLGGGLYAWHNIPLFSVKVAGAQAKVNASAPSYVPHGCANAGPATVEGNTVNISYQCGGSASQTYMLKEQAISQDSASLVANTATSTSQVQTIQDKGTPVSIITDKDRVTVTSTVGDKQCSMTLPANTPDLPVVEAAKIVGSC